MGAKKDFNNTNTHTNTELKVPIVRYEIALIVEDDEAYLDDGRLFAHHLRAERTWKFMLFVIVKSRLPKIFNFTAGAKSIGEVRHSNMYSS